MTTNRKCEIITEVYKDLTSHLITPPKLTFSTGLKTSAGRVLCYYWKGIECKGNKIELNIRMVEINPLLSMLDTLYHEFAHIITDCKYEESCGHNRNWVREFAKLSGLNPKGITSRHSQKIPPIGYKLKPSTIQVDLTSI